MGQDNAKNTEKWQHVATNPLQYHIYMSIIHVIHYVIIYDGMSKCLFPVLLINRNSMRAASCLPLKNMTYLDDVKTWKFFVTFGNLSKTTGIG